MTKAERSALKSILFDLLTGKGVFTAVVNAPCLINQQNNKKDSHVNNDTEESADRVKKPDHYITGRENPRTKTVKQLKAEYCDNCASSSRMVP
jgi:hypothetical protein